MLDTDGASMAPPRTNGRTRVAKALLHTARASDMARAFHSTCEDGQVTQGALDDLVDLLDQPAEPGPLGQLALVTEPRLVQLCGCVLNEHLNLRETSTSKSPVDLRERPRQRVPI